MQYRIADAATIELLEDLVTLMMNKDWRPQGGVCYCPTHERFYQAMWRQI